MKNGKRLLIVTALFLAACGGGAGDSNQNNPPSGPPAASADISLLFMGNSHTSLNNLTGIPQSFDLALARDPSLVLHAPDGNHSNSNGAFLAALILSATITGLSASALPPLPQFPVDVGTQTFLRGIAAETVQAWPPRAWCPSDPFP